MIPHVPRALFALIDIPHDTGSPCLVTCRVCRTFGEWTRDLPDAQRLAWAHDRTAHWAPPSCPKHCDVATPPEHVGGGIFVCTGCGTAFPWRPS